MNNDNLSTEQLAEMKWDPQKNQNVISLVKQTDGNWRGFMWRNGTLVQARQSDPGIVLQLLLTHA